MGSIGTIERLNAASKSKVRLEMVTKALIDLNKQISEAKKISMEPIPIDVLTLVDADCPTTSLLEEPAANGNSSATGPVFLLNSLVHEFIKLSSVIMDNSSRYAGSVEISDGLARCISLNRNKLRALVVKLYMKWLKDDIMIRNYRSMREKGNFIENTNFPVSLSTFIIKSVLTSSIRNDQVSTIILDRINNASNEAFTMEDLLLSEYINVFKDLRHFFLKNILNFLNKCSGANLDFYKRPEAGSENAGLMTAISLRVYHILVGLPVPSRESQLGEACDSSTDKTGPMFCSCFDGDPERAAKFDKNYRVLYQKLWLKYINIIITNYDDESRVVPLPILKDALEYLSEFVMPTISNPLELADVFKSCFDGAGSKVNPMDRLAISVISLNGLFYLIVNNRLNEGSRLDHDSEENISSGYYRRLYEILCPPVFSLKSRAKFLKLLSISLFSPLIPMTVLSCFIKKLVRISLFTSINNTVWIIALVNCLIKRHRCVLFPILSLNEGDDIYEYVSSILQSTQGELWSYEKDINACKSSQALSAHEPLADGPEEGQPSASGEMGAYLSSNFGLWELYIHNKSVVPVIRHVSNTLTLNASNAHVNHHIHSLNYEELIGLSTEEIVAHELSSPNGILHNYSACFAKERKCSVPYNYIQSTSLSSTCVSQASSKLFTDSDAELFSLI